MKRIDRLCLDAVERLGPDVRASAIADYVSERRWMLSRASIYPALYRLEDCVYIVSRWGSGRNRPRLYSVAADLAAKEGT